MKQQEQTRERVMKSLKILMALCVILISGCAKEKMLTADDFNDGVLDPDWQLVSHGCRVAETNGEIRIVGTTDTGHWWPNEIGMSGFPGGSFNASVDVSIPMFSGDGTKLVYLHVQDYQGDEYGLCYVNQAYYAVQVWDPRQFSEGIPSFGDEAETWHTMRLVYDDSAETLTGFVDELDIGSLHVKMNGKMKISLRVTTSDEDVDVDVRFDNFKLGRSLEPHIAPKGEVTKANESEVLEGKCDLQLQAIYWSPNGSMVTIDGENYHVGDKISGLTVQEIRKTEVVFLNPAGEKLVSFFYDYVD